MLLLKNTYKIFYFLNSHLLISYWLFLFSPCNYIGLFSSRRNSVYIRRLYLICDENFHCDFCTDDDKVKILKQACNFRSFWYTKCCFCVLFIHFWIIIYNSCFKDLLKIINLHLTKAFYLNYLSIFCQRPVLMLKASV